MNDLTGIKRSTLVEGLEYKPIDASTSQTYNQIR